jgi:hypothetical protein
MPEALVSSFLMLVVSGVEDVTGRTGGRQCSIKQWGKEILCSVDVDMRWKREWRWSKRVYLGGCGQKIRGRKKEGKSSLSWVSYGLVMGWCDFILGGVTVTGWVVECGCGRQVAKKARVYSQSTWRVQRG